MAPNKFWSRVFIRYFEFTVGVDSKTLICRGCLKSLLRILSSEAARNDPNETIGSGLTFHWLRAQKLKSDWLNDFELLCCFKNSSALPMN